MKNTDSGSNGGRGRDVGSGERPRYAPHSSPAVRESRAVHSAVAGRELDAMRMETLPRAHATEISSGPSPVSRVGAPHAGATGARSLNAATQEVSMPRAGSPRQLAIVRK